MTYNDPTQNPYDASSIDYEPQTMPLAEVIKMAIQAASLNLRVAMPCSIVKINGDQNVDVQPLLQTRYVDGTVNNIPVIHQVMVGMPRGANYSVQYPLAVGDTGLCIFSDRSLDAWSSGSGVITDPQDSRAHDIADPIFYPGLVPFGKQTTDTNGDSVYKTGQYTFRIGKTKITLGKGGTLYTAVLGEPLVAILHAIIDAYNIHVHTGNLGAPTTVPTVQMDIPDLDNNKLLCDDGGGF